MKKTGLLIVIGLVLAFKADAKRLGGKILHEKDTLDVIFKIPVSLFTQEINFEKLQHRIKYFDSTGEKGVLRPDEAEEIRFFYNHEEIRMLSRFCPHGLNNLFSKNHYYLLKMEIDGKLKLFRYYYTENSPVVYDASTDVIIGRQSYSACKYILQKLSEELFMTRTLTFRKDLMEYFQDCPELSMKIQNREYRRKDMESIVRYYNSYCTN